jgi:ribosomal protein L15
MKLHHLRPAAGAKQRKIRVGRGESGRRGKTAGRGTKGQKARGAVRPGFEGGQMPLQRRLPKLKGFKNRNKEVFVVVNVDRLAEFDADGTVTPDDLRAHREGARLQPRRRGEDPRRRRHRRSRRLMHLPLPSPSSAHRGRPATLVGG